MQTSELLRKVRRLEIRSRRLVEDLLSGQTASVFKGRGIEFADVREYEPGDDVRSIDWHVSARTGKTFIKRFTEERELTVVIAMAAEICSAPPPAPPTPVSPLASPPLPPFEPPTRGAAGPSGPEL